MVKHRKERIIKVRIYFQFSCKFSMTQWFGNIFSGYGAIENDPRSLRSFLKLLNKLKKNLFLIIGQVLDLFEPIKDSFVSMDKSLNIITKAIHPLPERVKKIPASINNLPKVLKPIVNAFKYVGEFLEELFEPFEDFDSLGDNFISKRNNVSLANSTNFWSV